ncbi:MAG: hypothetical protein ACD_39C02123G0001 [uncultured bacterium]|nr:MAG: hypothetical protein ACD_39C02123G0001 [uncultured bacterium]
MNYFTRLIYIFSFTVIFMLVAANTIFANEPANSKITTDDWQKHIEFGMPLSEIYDKYGEPIYKTTNYLEYKGFYVNIDDTRVTGYGPVSSSDTLTIKAKNTDTKAASHTENNDTIITSFHNSLNAGAQLQKLQNYVLLEKGWRVKFEIEEHGQLTNKVTVSKVQLTSDKAIVVANADKITEIQVPETGVYEITQIAKPNFAEPINFVIRLVKVKGQEVDDAKRVENTVLETKEKQRLEEQNKREYPAKYPLHQAVLDYNKPAIAELIASSSISINAFDCYECTPCDVARKLTDPGKGLEIFNLLKNAGGSTAAEVKKFAALKDGKNVDQPSWEYQTIFFTDMELITISFDERVNELGKEGWEMISSRRAKSDFDGWGFEASLKRKKSL